MMGCDSRTQIVTRGWLDTVDGPQLAWAAPRSPKKKKLMPYLQASTIILKGHQTDEDFPIFEGDVKINKNGYTTTRMILDGRGGRFIDAAGDGGASLMSYLKENVVLHTLKPDTPMTLLNDDIGENGNDERTENPVDFYSMLIDALGSPVELEPAKPKDPEAKTLFTDVMLERLKAKRDVDPPKPMYKLFMPEGSATWFVCSLEDDGDTLWVIADLGMGFVEYGTASLTEFSTLRGPRFGLPMERDKYWSPPKMNFVEILELQSLQEAR